jgi:hypothetical protein
MPVGGDWTRKKEKLLKYWQEECRLYSWLYSQNVLYYQAINRNLSIISILLSAITGATLLNNTNDPNPVLVMTFGLISVVASFIQGLRQFLDLDSKISSNTFVSRQNSAIVIDIEEQLNLSRDERINGKEFIKTIKARKNEIIQNAPLISKYRWTQLKKKIERGDGISFFNESIFKNYLDNTVEMSDLKLDTGGEDTTPDRGQPINSTIQQRVSFATAEPDLLPEQQPATHSEDELIESLQDDNRCSYQLRKVLVQPESVQNPAATTETKHKLDTVLKYHMSRL